MTPKVRRQAPFARSNTLVVPPDPVTTFCLICRDRHGEGDVGVTPEGKAKPTFMVLLPDPVTTFVVVAMAKATLAEGQKAAAFCNEHLAVRLSVTTIVPSGVMDTAKVTLV